MIKLKEKQWKRDTVGPYIGVNKKYVKITMINKAKKIKTWKNRWKDVKMCSERDDF